MHGLRLSLIVSTVLLSNAMGCTASQPSSLMVSCPVPSSRTVVSGDELARSGSSSLTEALQGRVAGLIVTYDRTGRRALSIRGRSSFQRAEPLVVVDEVWQAQRGIPALDRINVRDVAFVEVLKDSDASARYGSEGGSGVIAITLLRGGCDASGTRAQPASSERSRARLSVPPSRLRLPPRIST